MFGRSAINHCAEGRDTSRIPNEKLVGKLLNPATLRSLWVSREGNARAGNLHIPGACSGCRPHIQAVAGVGANLEAVPTTESTSAQQAPITLGGGEGELSVLPAESVSAQQAPITLEGGEDELSVLAVGAGAGTGVDASAESLGGDVPAVAGAGGSLEEEGGELRVFAAGAGACAGVDTSSESLGDSVLWSPDQLSHEELLEQQRAFLELQRHQSHMHSIENGSNASAGVGAGMSPATPQRAACDSRRSKRRKFGGKSRVGLKVQVRDDEGSYWDATIVKDHGHCPCQSFVGLRKDFDVDYGEPWEPAVETNVSRERIKWPD